MTLGLEAHLAGRLLRRYKRFLADIETDSGRVLTVHCPDPGSMRDCAVPGARVRCSKSDNPRRKLRHTLEMIRRGRTWVGVHTGRANALAALALDAALIPELAGYRERQSEVRVMPGTRLDFRLHGSPADARSAFLEVKSVTLAEGHQARFPDSVTERGRKHLEILTRLRARGDRAALLFVVQRRDCDQVAPADDIDPAYGKALRAAADAGVEVFAVGAHVTPKRIRLTHRLPVDLR
ncbi:MAG: DNA/RNA nuclease SfsA [Proteobacteria bacterium]|nr:DNA/RNA nuclease SfsA [Pseudomonadota bacterium]